jgi:hypothetical protein
MQEIIDTLRAGGLNKIPTYVPRTFLQGLFLIDKIPEPTMINMLTVLMHSLDSDKWTCMVGMAILRVSIV